jgi:addiction module RelE/StbE family toxin
VAGARANLISIVEYIAHDNPIAATNIDETIHRHVARLSETPRIGRSGRVKGTRELVVPGTPYIVAYRIARDEVRIIRVLHGARRWPDRL